MSLATAADRLADALSRQREGFVAVVTGAGISHASGIPTFRGSDSDAIWNVSDVEMATFAFFRSDPLTQWRWYLQRFEALDGARPNPAHRALVEYETWQVQGGGRYLLVTQNIDTLHEEAGSDALIKVHGTNDRLRCVRPGCDLAEPHGSIDREDPSIELFAAEPSIDTLPECPACGDLLRAHVLFFDEYYTSHVDYRFDEVEGAAEAADLVLFVGTSFSVGVTELFVRAGAQRGIPLVAIDPEPLASPDHAHAIEHIEAAAEDVLPLSMARLQPQS